MKDGSKQKTKHFIKLYTDWMELIDVFGLDVTDVVLLCMVESMQENSKSFYASNAYMATFFGESIRTVQRRVKKLKELDLIAVYEVRDRYGATTREIYVRSTNINNAVKELQMERKREELLYKKALLNDLYGE